MSSDLSSPSSKHGQCTQLTGRVYDVRELDSIAIILVGESSLRGLYRLGFADGSVYVGQSVNVVSRFRSHRRRWNDIVTFEFFPLPEGDLDDPERALIADSERASSVRNVRDTQRPHGGADVEFTSIEGGTTVLPWDREKRVRPGENVIGRDSKKFLELARMVEYEVLRDLLGWFIYEALPDPYNTHRHLWIVSCLPATNRSQSHRRLLVVSAGNLEIFVVCQHMVAGVAEIELFINTARVDGELASLQDPEGRWYVENSAYPLSEVTRWHFTMEGLEDILTGLVDFPHTEPLLNSAYQLNVRLMRQGGTMFGRFHNELLASDLLAASLKWGNDEWRAAIRIGEEAAH